MNVHDISFVDKPKLGPTNYLALTSMYLTAAISLVLGSLFPSQLILLFIAFIIVIMVAPIHYCWINTRYELSDSQLRIRSGFYKKDIVLESIIGVRVDRRYSPLAIHPPIVKYRDRVRLIGEFGRIMITPDNPVEFIKELQKRVPHLKVEGKQIY